MNDIPLGDPVWETLIPNRSLKAIYNKAQRLMSEKPKSKEPERINGWLVPTQEENNMPNAQASPEPADERLALLGQLYTLVQQFPEYVTYDIRVNFGGGIHFGANNPDKSK